MSGARGPAPVGVALDATGLQVIASGISARDSGGGGGRSRAVVDDAEDVDTRAWRPEACQSRFRQSPAIPGQGHFLRRLQRQKLDDFADVGDGRQVA